MSGVHLGAFGAHFGPWDPFGGGALAYFDLFWFILAYFRPIGTHLHIGVGPSSKVRHPSLICQRKSCCQASPPSVGRPYFACCRPWTSKAQGHGSKNNHTYALKKRQIGSKGTKGPKWAPGPRMSLRAPNGPQGPEWAPGPQMGPRFPNGPQGREQAPGPRKGPRVPNGTQGPEWAPGHRTGPRAPNGPKGPILVFSMRRYG